MSAIPQPEPSDDRGPDPLVEQLLTEAEAKQSAQGHDVLIALAKQRGAQELLYTWQTEDFEADVRVYYEIDADNFTVLAVKLEQLDYRQPSPCQRVHIENLMQGCIEDGGDVYLELGSHIWEQAR